jgi:ATP-dependent helicase HepA
MSEAEPELGLATVVHTGSGRVRVEFESAGEARTYAAEQAPLKRVRFRAGDKVRTREDQEFLVKEVIEQQGLLIYVGENQRLPEAQLSDRLSLRGPQERLVAGRFDTSAAFELRRRTLDLLHRSRKSPVRGFLGGRIDLIPHQLYIAQEVANRHAARVMLSDEVGLGKTIEACLILHRLLLSGRADRILVLVPALRQSALKQINHLLGHEVERLQMLARVNDHVRPRPAGGAGEKYPTIPPPTGLLAAHLEGYA